MKSMKFQSESAVLDEVITAAQLVPLSQAVDVNPKIDRTALHDDLDVSFVPMAAVEALSGGIDVSTVRKYGEVKRAIHISVMATFCLPKSRRVWKTARWPLPASW